MHTNIFITGLTGAVVGASLVWLMQYNWSATDTMWSSDAPTVKPMSEHMMDDAAGHMAMMQQMFVTSERAFIEQMIPHHEEAIATAQEVLERGGTTDEIRALMNDIVTAQTAEVAEMKEWYKEWFGEPFVATNTYEPMMRDLSALSGAALDQAFLEDMIPHHMGAIMLARSVQPHIEHNEMRELTENIVRTQSAEIVAMQEMLAGFVKIDAGT
ncbi:MAG TPA: DUF305 domain-containing protein [Candidatus Paceibacterota bacterium]|nr:DUF305 domain-containing protein [Candidatus Paceibacterota bacterium]